MFILGRVVWQGCICNKQPVGAKTIRRTAPVSLSVFSSLSAFNGILGRPRMAGGLGGGFWIQRKQWG